MHPCNKYCCCSVAKSCLTLCDSVKCSMPGLPVLYYLPEGMVTQGVMSYCACGRYLLLSVLGILCSNSCPSSQWCHLTISSSVAPSPPAFNLSQHQGLFKWAALCIRWLNYWSFSFSITPFNEHSWLSSFRIDCLDLLAFHSTLKSLLQL